MSIGTLKVLPHAPKNNLKVTIVVDSKRRGVRLPCRNCGRQTRHVQAGKNNVHLDVDDYGRTSVTKIQWLICIECGECRLESRW